VANSDTHSLTNIAVTCSLMVRVRVMVRVRGRGRGRVMVRGWCRGRITVRVRVRVMPTLICSLTPQDRMWNQASSDRSPLRSLPLSSAPRLSRHYATTCKVEVDIGFTDTVADPLIG